ncbi:hypothetical protein FBU30_004859 [Linnemannia zychae]|nr:hypothetical protein FBU30_004859 [Linnemannia zychae]
MAYISEYAVAPGFPSSNNGPLSPFLGLHSVRSTWIALFVLWIFWALLFLTKQMFGSTQIFGAPNKDRAVATSGAPVVAEQGPYDVHDAAPVTNSAPRAQEPAVATTANRRSGFFRRSIASMRERVERTHDLIRDLTLMLFLVVAVNTLGQGSGRSVLILTWIYLAFALCWAALLMMVESRVLDLILGLIQMLILLAILIIAFAAGWAVM